MSQNFDLPDMPASVAQLVRDFAAAIAPKLVEIIRENERCQTDIKWVRRILFDRIAAEITSDKGDPIEIASLAAIMWDYARGQRRIIRSILDGVRRRLPSGYHAEVDYATNRISVTDGRSYARQNLSPIDRPTEEQIARELDAALARIISIPDISQITEDHAIVAVARCAIARENDPSADETFPPVLTEVAVESVIQDARCSRDVAVTALAYYANQSTAIEYTVTKPARLTDAGRALLREIDKTLAERYDATQ